MEIKMEAKTLAIGALLGAAIIIALGAAPARDRATGRLVPTGEISDTSSRTDYSMAVASDGYAFVRTQNGDFFIVNPKTAMAVRILHMRRLIDDPTRTRDVRGKIFNYMESGITEEAEGGGGGYGK